MGNWYEEANAAGEVEDILIDKAIDVIHQVAIGVGEAGDVGEYDIFLLQMRLKMWQKCHGMRRAVPDIIRINFLFVYLVNYFDLHHLHSLGLCN